ncbi:MAG: hypothetical protein HY726_08095 [Candidatus Rokubacteria bacterium]|nr:hypothetical protein [Candidatus Rokubacteria bacterium]
MRSILRLALVLSTVTLGAAAILEAQEGLTKRDRQGPVAVTVTLTTPPAIGAPIRARVVLDTHSVALDDIKFEEVVLLRTPDGSDMGPTAVEQAAGGGHHRQAVLVFPAITQPGSARVIVKNVGGVAERSFAWELAPAR